MPYIDVKTAAPLSEAQKESLKTGLGRLITLIPGKTEAVTMISLAGGSALYMGGRALDRGAYVAIHTFGEAAREHKEAVARAVAQLLAGELQVEPDQLYVTFSGHSEWGCGGGMI